MTSGNQALGGESAKHSAGFVFLISRRFDRSLFRQLPINAPRDVIQLEQKVIAPAAKRPHRLTSQPCFIDLGAALRASDGFASEC
ncbi:MAG TPA: hypothetical protein DCR78_09645 [Pseudomonas sp.]|nr:hypothetical protein [Pseudomonas sp.]HAW22770.1 hypothetical protein [Pseudomonas sp.]